MEQKKQLRTIAQNKKARHDYFVIESIEAGISLAGTEVKSLRAGNVNLKDSWCDIYKGEVFLRGMHISPYEKGNIFNRDPVRERKLLLHKREIYHLLGQIKQEGLTLIPLSLYFKGQHVKVQLGLCKGKKLYDKRADMANKAAKRDIQRALKERSR
ncbi:SsrA-binding protein SmpB [Neobittarella massiliensis]|uniref:SsrA-binding protein SmpB n=1 Tax=Neobittarella massiliensis (ex Bilen et al. 2018) TaxID=2041842 RepID=UPI000CF6C258|nr:SsrA-binding protein SmpB [Neobittarella massiliensis]